MKISVDDIGCMPTKAFPSDMGFDLRSNQDDIEVYMGEQKTIDTGVRMAIPEGYGGLVIPRSGLGRKYRMNMANTVGAIDAQYRGNIFVSIINNGDRPFTIKKFERFCQIIILPVFLCELELTKSLDETDRGDGGFGHTGVK